MRTFLDAEPRAVHWFRQVRGSIQFGLQYIKAYAAVDQVNQPTIVKRHIIGLRRRPAAHRLRDEPANFLWRQRIHHIDDA